MSKKKAKAPKTKLAPRCICSPEQLEAMGCDCAAAPRIGWFDVDNENRYLAEGIWYDIEDGSE